MAWIWWLLAPMGTTVLGACLMWWSGQRETRSAAWPRADAIGEHQAMLAALPQPRPGDPVPVNFVVLGAPSQQSGPDGG